MGATKRPQECDEANRRNQFMRKLIAATALGTVLLCSSPAFAQGVGFCDPRHSLKAWVCSPVLGWSG
jgi:hypothetical protein